MLSSSKASPGLIIRFVSYRKAWYHSTYNIVISSRKRGVFPYIYQSIIAQGSLKDLTSLPFSRVVVSCGKCFTDCPNVREN